MHKQCLKMGWTWLKYAIQETIYHCRVTFLIFFNIIYPISIYLRTVTWTICVGYPRSNTQGKNVVYAPSSSLMMDKPPRKETVTFVAAESPPSLGSRPDVVPDQVWVRTLSQRNFELNEFLLTRTVRRIFSIEYLARGKLARDRLSVSWNKRKSGAQKMAKVRQKKKAVELGLRHEMSLPANVPAGYNRVHVPLNSQWMRKT